MTEKEKETMSRNIYTRSDGTKITSFYDSEKYIAEQESQNQKITDESNIKNGLKFHYMDRIDGTHEKTITDADGNITITRTFPNNSKTYEEVLVNGTLRFMEMTPDGIVYIVKRDRDGIITKEEYSPDGTKIFSITYTNGDHCSKHIDASGEVSEYTSSPCIKIPDHDMCDYETAVKNFTQTYEANGLTNA